MKKITLITFCLWFSLSSFNSEKVTSINSKDYYFPIEKLSTPKVYHYQSNSPNFGDLYWLLSSSVQNDSTFLNLQSFSIDSNNLLMHVANSKILITAVGAETVEYEKYLYLTSYDSNSFNLIKDGMGLDIEITQCSILRTNMTDNQVFLWNLEANEQLKWNSSYYSPTEQNIINFKGKTRQLLSNSSFSFENKSYTTKKFIDHIETSSFDAKKQEMVYTFNYLEYCEYAKGLGLCKLEKRVDEIPIIYTLTEILSEREWANIKESSLRIKNICTD